MNKNLSTHTKDFLQLLGVLLVLMSFAAILSKGVFLSPINLFNITIQNIILMIAALGQLLIIISGGIDLSVGSIVGFSSVFFVLLQDMASPVAYIILLVAIIIIGCINGALVTCIKLPAFVVTMAMGYIVFSIAKIIGGGASVYVGKNGGEISATVMSLYKSQFLGIPYALLIAVLCIIGVSLYIRTSMGHFIYTIGGNQKTAFLSGVPVVRVKIAVYIFAAILASIAGIMFVGRVGLGDPQAGDLLTLDSIAAVTVGGASLSGGVGTVAGTVMGVLILGVLNNILNLLNVPPSIQPAIKGSIILLAVFLNSRKNRS